MKVNQDSEILILDFDHTLFLSNSTEEYLDSARPKFLCALLLALIEGLKLWNLFPGENKRFVYRDVIRIIVVSILLPWTYFLYIFRIDDLLKQHLNSEVVNLASSKTWNKIIIASNGFNLIINPLLKKININFDLVLCARLFHSKDSIRQDGKRLFLQKKLVAHELTKATFLTDNPEDKDLIDVVGELQFHEWQQAKHFRAAQDAYIPFVYTEASNRGNKNHVVKTVILTDFSIIILTYAFSTPISIQLILSLFLLVFSFWCIYETGYYENDSFELRYESNGQKNNNIDKLRSIEKFQDYPIHFNAWIWASLSGLLGLLLLRNHLNINTYHNFAQLALDLSIWLGWLIGTRVVFRIYNYCQLRFRMSLYPILQVSRLAGPILFLPTNFLGIFLITSQVVSRWVWYLVYRANGDPHGVPHHFVRDLVFIVLVIGLAIVQKDPNVFGSWQLALILLWSIAKGYGQVFFNVIGGICRRK